MLFGGDRFVLLAALLADRSWSVFRVDAPHMIAGAGRFFPLQPAAPAGEGWEAAEGLTETMVAAVIEAGPVSLPRFGSQLLGRLTGEPVLAPVAEVLEYGQTDFPPEITDNRQASSQDDGQEKKVFHRSIPCRGPFRRAGVPSITVAYAGTCREAEHGLLLEKAGKRLAAPFFAAGWS